MEGIHRFFNGDSLVKPMDLKQVDIVNAESLETCIHSIEDGLPREAAVVYVVFGLWHRRIILDLSLSVA